MKECSMSNESYLTRRRVLSAALTTCATAVPAARALAQTPQGFIGDLLFRPAEQPNGTVLFEVTKDFGYVDSTGIRWQAKAGVQTDGASIPRIFWPIIGHPYEGLYLKAAVIHDYYCTTENRYRKWENVHRVFYEAMQFNGVGAIKAALMYFAVWRFGPRWDIAELKPCTPGPNEFCASAQVAGYRVFSEGVGAFDEKAEEARLRDFQRLAETKLPPLDQIPEIEARLPPIARVRTTRDVDAKSDQGWYFRNPYRMPIAVPGK